MMLTFVLFCAIADPGAPFKTIAHGSMSALDEARQAVVRTEAEWERLWNRHAPDRPPPAVDFATSMVVGVFLGSRATAGYSVDIIDVRRQGETLVVEFKERGPSPDAVVAQIITSPFHLVSVARFAGEVRFVRSTDTVGKER